MREPLGKKTRVIEKEKKLENTNTNTVQVL